MNFNERKIFVDFDSYYGRISPKVEYLIELIDDVAIFKLNDDTYVKYDNILKTVRFFKDLDEAICSCKKANPQTEEEWRHLFGKKLYRQIQRHGYSLEMLSDDTGISVGALSNYTNGISSPSVWKLKKIAEALECDVSYLIEL